MLAQMKSKARRSERLKRAIEENIAHEAGFQAESHVTPRSADDEEPRTRRDRCTHAWSVHRSSALLDIGRIQSFRRGGGRRLAPRCRVTRPGPLRANGTELRLARLRHPLLPRAHRVDSDEHATWMAESVEEVVDLYGPAALAQVTMGLNESWAETRAVPDALWARHLARAA